MMPGVVREIFPPSLEKHICDSLREREREREREKDGGETYAGVRGVSGASNGRLLCDRRTSLNLSTNFRKSSFVPALQKKELLVVVALRERDVCSGCFARSRASRRRLCPRSTASARARRGGRWRLRLRCDRPGRTNLTRAHLFFFPKTKKNRHKRAHATIIVTPAAKKGRGRSTSPREREESARAGVRRRRRRRAQSRVEHVAGRQRAHLHTHKRPCL